MSRRQCCNKRSIGEAVIANKKFVEGINKISQLYYATAILKRSGYTVEMWQDFCMELLGFYLTPSIYYKSKHVRMNQINAKIYEAEIMKIQSCRLKAEWQKKFLLAILVYDKINQRTGHLTGFVEASVLPFLKVNNKRCVQRIEMQQEALEEALRVGLIYRDEVSEKIVADENGEVVYEFKSCYEVNDVDCFSNMICCPQCGKIWKGNNYTRRTLCDECYEEMRRNRER